MTDSPDKKLEITDGLLDRLVDGELPESTRRDVLRSLDDNSGGWRRCALAFLQAQWFDREFRSLQHGDELSLGQRGESSSSVTLPAHPAARVGVSASQTPSHFWPLAMAAALLVAFLVGYSTRGRHNTPEQAPAVSVADSAPSVIGAAGNTLPHLPGGVPAAEANAVAPVSATFVNAVSPEEYWKNPSALPRAVQQELRRLGIDVRQQRGFVPMRLVDGDQVMVPYEDVRIVPVRGPSY